MDINAMKCKRLADRFFDVVILYIPCRGVERAF